MKNIYKLRFTFYELKSQSKSQIDYICKMLKNLRTIIIDDEERAINSLSTLLNLYVPEVKIEATCKNVPDGVIAIQKYQPQLVFLDIEMPEYNGFEIFKFFKEVDFEVIFVTAYNDFALKAFEVSAIDYLLKPVDIDKLKLAIEKAIQKLNNQDIQSRLEILQDNYKNNQFYKIALPVSDGLIFVNTEDIMYLEADGAYTEVWTKDGSKIVVSKKMKFFEEVLDSNPCFFRSHRSYIVNINFIKKYSKSENYISLDNGKTISIARDRKAHFEQQLKDNNLSVG